MSPIITKVPRATSFLVPPSRSTNQESNSHFTHTKTCKYRQVLSQTLSDPLIIHCSRTTRKINFNRMLKNQKTIQFPAIQILIQIIIFNSRILVQKDEVLLHVTRFIIQQRHLP